MHNYELMTIAKSSLTDDKAKQVSKEIQDFVVSKKGIVTKSDYWGKRKLAYEVDGFKEGYYDVIRFEYDPAEVSKLKSKIGLMDNVLRYLVTSIPHKRVDLESAKAKKTVASTTDTSAAEA